MHLSKKIFLFLISSVLLNVLAIFYFSPREELKIYFLDVGQGDAILISDSYGRQIIIDGGPNDKLSHYLSKLMPFGDKKIETVLVTHAHYDHYKGLLKVLDDYEVGQIVLPKQGSSAKTWGRFIGEIKEKNIPIYAATGKSRIYIDKNYLEIVWQGIVAKDPNNSSIISQINAGDYNILFMGDAGAVIENTLMANGKIEQVEILKVGHHGSKYASSRKFLKKTRPEYAIISVGKNNSYGHPHKEALLRLESEGIKIFRTDIDGNIVVKCRESNCKVERLRW